MNIQQISAAEAALQKGCEGVIYQDSANPQILYVRGATGTLSQNKLDTTAIQAAVSGAGISSAALATTTGTPGAMYSLTDGADAGAKLTWAIPSGASAYTWCWWLWPQAAYQA